MVAKINFKTTVTLNAQ